MYDWLNGALQDSSQVVTASRRLARVLTAAYARQQVEAGRKAWRTPRILAWQDWLDSLLDTAELSRPMPARLNSHQSRVLWERCLKREISNPLLNISALVRQSRDTWKVLHDYKVPLDQVASAAQGRDQRIFASAAFSYASILEREGWIDEAALTAFITEIVIAGQAGAGDSLVFAGFDRMTPAAMTLIDELGSNGVQCRVIDPAPQNERGAFCAYENADAELRAAGAWARQQLLDQPEQVVAIVASQLERNAERSARLLREGFAPGWQASGDSREATVNVSYGRRLNAYPVVAIALLLLRWLHEDIGSHEVSRLLRSMAVGSREMGGRSRLDTELRRLPAMSWSPERFLKTFRRNDDDVTTRDWFERLSILAAERQNLPARQSPSEWAMAIDGVLGKLNWPGEAALDSTEFQLVNRWRELLNDFARLELVATSMSLGEALGRLQTLASETVFQPEGHGAIVHLLGPLEAAGIEFDQLWVSGLTAANWPPPSRPSPLLSRQLQRDFEMPDNEPADTLAFARGLLKRLAGSTRHLHCSYALTDGDAEQAPAGLIDEIADTGAPSKQDPGWYAAMLVDCAVCGPVAADPVPSVTADEVVTGGASTLQRQLADPFAAFAYGRLGVRPIQALVYGLPANVRGSLIHGALHALYRDHPAQADIVSWQDNDIEKRISGALAAGFARLERESDAALRPLVDLEKQRVGDLLRAVVRLEAGREAFSIASLEDSAQFVADNLALNLRIDRIDRLANGELVILDYKTGQKRKFVNASMEADDLQLVVYACALDEAVAGLGYVNVDSRAVDLSGAGREFTPDVDWDAALSEWRNEVLGAAADLQKGDVRINGALPIKATRTFGLLNRIRELQHGD